MNIVFLGEYVGYLAAVFAVVGGLYKAMLWLRTKAKKPKKEQKNSVCDSVALRFIRLFESHGVHRNQIPEFFGHNVTLADVQTEERLVEKLTPEILSDAAELFFINSEWLAHGHGDIYPKHHFYKQPEKFGQFIDKQRSKYEKHHFQCKVFRSERKTTAEYDALLILKTPIGELGDRFIYAYHICPGWMTYYWKSAADLACCISQSMQRKVYPHGCIVQESWLSEIMNCQKLLEYDFEEETMDYPYAGHWNPGEFSDTAKEFIEPLKINADNYSIPSALDRWWAYYKKGLIYVCSEDINSRVGQEFMDMAESYGLELLHD